MILVMVRHPFCRKAGNKFRDNWARDHETEPSATQQSFKVEPSSASTCEGGFFINTGGSSKKK